LAPTLDHSSIVVLLAGIAFLLYGLSRASEALQKLAANQIRKVLTRVSESGIVSVFVGVGLTLLMQSSAAVTATLVNLGTARVLSLPQVMGVLIGAAIGASLTVQLISLHMTGWGLPMFAVGFLVVYMARGQKVRDSFEFVMSIGLLFFGIELIGLGSRGLFSIQGFETSLQYVRDTPILALALAALVTSIFHSSTATLGVIIALATNGVLDVKDAVLWIYGANIGTTTTGLMASMRGDYVGKRIAWANFFYRLATVLVFAPFTEPALVYLEQWFTTPASQIAFFYTIMNLFSASVFFPLRGFGVRMIEALVQPSSSEREFGVRFLKRSNYESFSIAMAHAKREILEMGDIVFEMVEGSIDLFRELNLERAKEIRECDNKVDLLLKEIKLFLIRASEMSPEGLNQNVIDLVSFGSDLEAAADIIDHHIAGLAQKKHANQFEFSDEDWKDLEELHRNVVRALSLAISVFQTDDPKLAVQMVALKREVRAQENRVREAHIARLSKGISVGIGISAVYLECVGTYLQLVEMLAKHSQRLRNAHFPRPESSSST